MAGARSPSWYGFAVITVVAATAGYWMGRPAAAPPVSNDVTSAQENRRIKFYQSPMHPWITSDQPGRCTICGMALVAVYEGDPGVGDGETITLSDSTASVIGVATAVVRETDLTQTLRVNGTLETDHTRHRVLTARVPGRIESLSVNQVGQAVAAGEPLVTLYSTAMLTAQRIYLEKLTVGTGAVSASEISAARERLLDLGAVDTAIARLEETRRPEPLVTVRAPFTGTVINRGDNAYAGAYVDEADTLFELGDLSTLWFVFDVYEPDLSRLEIGQPVAVTPASVTDDPTVGYISFIDPNLDAVTRTGRARVVLHNPHGSLRHRQTATGEVTVSPGTALSVPRSAVLFTRQKPTVFVARAGHAYTPRTVSVGRATTDHFEITGGLQTGERVVSRAALLLDSQAQLASPAMMAPVTTLAVTVSPSLDDIATFETVVLATADAAAALANDDLPGYIESLPPIHTAWGTYLDSAPDAADGPLAEKINALIDGPTLEDARAPFELFSTQIADLARTAGLHHAGKVSIFQCSMSPVLSTGRWVQRTDELRNPFYGEMMLTCGEKLD